MNSELFSVTKAEAKRNFNRRLSSHNKIIESFKARMDKRRTFTERLADRATELAGSPWFLMANITLFIIWVLINTEIIPLTSKFDPYPFVFLTSAVSLEAIILAILVLISQNRSAKIADMRQEIQLQMNIIDEEETTKVIQMLSLLLEKNGIDLSDDLELQSMLKPTNPEKIEEAITHQIENGFSSYTNNQS